ncbi:MAG TPA: trigger factor [Vitreimonas sp.]|nr:trigger factor [Vitreimonas sp.]
MPKTSTPKTKSAAAHDHSHHDHDHNHDHDHSHAPAASQNTAIGPNTVIKLTLAWKTVEPVYTKIRQRLAQRVKLPGFRAGKAPTALAEGAVGQEKILDAVLEQLLPAVYTEAVTKAKKVPLTNPDIKPISLHIGQDWELEAQIAEAPEVKLGDYKKIVTEAKKEAAKQVAEIEKKQAEESKKTTSKDKKGSADTQTPPAPTTRPLTDDDKKELNLRAIFAHLIRTINPTVPELLVREETRHDLHHLVEKLEQLKLSLDEYLTRRGMTFEQLSGELAATALARIQLDFILSTISNTEKIVPTDADVEAQIQKIQDEKLRAEQAQNDEYRRYVKGVLTRQHTVDFLAQL